MPEAHPDLRLLRVLLEHALVDLDRLRVVAEVGEDRGLQEAIGRVARLTREQLLDLAERRRGVALPHQHRGVVVTCHVEARRELEAALEQLLGIRIAAQPCGDLRQHAQRGDVGRVALKVRAQPRIRYRQLVRHQRGGGLESFGSRVAAFR